MWSCACGTCQFCIHCVTPKVLTPEKCEIPCCHGCTCDLLMRVRDLEHKPPNGHDTSLLGACLVAVTLALSLRPLHLQRKRM